MKYYEKEYIETGKKCEEELCGVNYDLGELNAKLENWNLAIKYYAAS